MKPAMAQILAPYNMLSWILQIKVKNLMLYHAWKLKGKVGWWGIFKEKREKENILTRKRKENWIINPSYICTFSLLIYVSIDFMQSLSIVYGKYFFGN